MNNIRNGQNGGRGDPPWMYYGSRGDPPIETGARGRPTWMFGSRGDPPIRSGTRGHPPEIGNTRDGPPIANATRGQPPELKIKRTNSLNGGLTFRSIGGENGPHGRGMPERELSSARHCERPQGAWQSDQVTDCFVVPPRNDDQKSYSLPSALADGHGNHIQSILANDHRQRVIANGVKQSHIRTDCHGFVPQPRNDDE